MEELKARASNIEHPIGSVWTPEQEHVITVFEARCLFDEIRGVESRFSRRQLTKSAGITAVFGAIWWMSPSEGSLLMLLLMVVLGVVPTIQQIWQLFRLTRLKPEAMANWPVSLRYQS